jgi:hypothetical protein
VLKIARIMTASITPTAAPAIELSGFKTGNLNILSSMRMIVSTTNIHADNIIKNAIHLEINVDNGTEAADIRASIAFELNWVKISVKLAPDEAGLFETLKTPVLFTPLLDASPLIVLLTYFCINVLSIQLPNG